ncbi:MAG: hypothetical protein LBO74_05135 [Candidatus Symbiothrix sp.]|jgi:hypothetical protein|nr:hypothetical protein [Candidatus Symbiothrix sp.]
MKKIVFLVLTLIVLGTAGANAQVIIGDNTKEPHPGAILDLSPLGGQNLGLLLPNFVLQNTTTLQLGSSSADSDADAKGMIIYNPTKTGAIEIGIYVWDGNDWKPVVTIK